MARCGKAALNGKNRPLADIRACSCGCPLPGQIADFLSAGGSRVILAQVFENVAVDAVVVDERDHAHLFRAAGARHDVIERRRIKYRENPDPHFLTFGPKNRREFLANLKARGESPV